MINFDRTEDDLVATLEYAPIEGAAGCRRLPILRYRFSGGRDWPLVAEYSCREKIGRSAVRSGLSVSAADIRVSERCIRD